MRPASVSISEASLLADIGQSLHACTSEARPATARTKVLRIHRVDRTKETLDWIGTNTVVVVLN
jgi:hypothetical protein